MINYVLFAVIENLFSLCPFSPYSSILHLYLICTLDIITPAPYLFLFRIILSNSPLPPLPPHTNGHFTNWPSSCKFEIGAGGFERERGEGG